MRSHQKNDIDNILRNWPFEQGMVNVRITHADDGREVLQMRVELGVLQLEMKNRPDGELPNGSETYLDHLVQENFHGNSPAVLSEEQCIEVDREFSQYYQRRVCWLALREFDKAIKDANHTLQLMDVAVARSPDKQWSIHHERYRPFVLFHRTQAKALAALENSQPKNAIRAIIAGIDVIRKTSGVTDDIDNGKLTDNEMTTQLHDLQTWIRDNFEIGHTLDEQLAAAVANEQYELAAELRDKIAKQQSSPI